MPQATEELRVKWGGRQGVGEDKAIAHLQDRGYRLTGQWTWQRASDGEPTEDDLEAIMFLIQEWDYGGLEQSE